MRKEEAERRFLSRVILKPVWISTLAFSLFLMDVYDMKGGRDSKHGAYIHLFRITEWAGGWLVMSIVAQLN
jgi:hypothetical protein